MDAENTVLYGPSTSNQVYAVKNFTCHHPDGEGGN
jgi:hypothetical protein